MSSPQPVWLAEFIDRSAATARYPNIGSNLSYPCLGLGGEAGEVVGKLVVGDSAGALTEIGDVVWYVAAVAREAEVVGDVVVAPASAMPARDALAIAIGQVQERAKKSMRDHAGVLPEEWRPVIADGLSAVLAALAELADDLGSSLPEVCEATLLKLAGRAERGTLHGEGDVR